MRHRRIVIDSDDDIDDFPSLRPSRYASAGTAKTATARGSQAQAQAQAKAPAPAVTPKLSKIEPADASDPPQTTVRRRRLGKINNDASLLRPWKDFKQTSLQRVKPDVSGASGINLPQNVSPEPMHRKPRVELRTRKTRRISELPADDAGELSTEEASVLEDVTLQEDYGEPSSGNIHDSSAVDIEYTNKRSLRQEGQHNVATRRKGRKSQGEGDKPEDVGSQDEEVESGDDGDDGDDNEDSSSDNDSEISEFQDSSVCSDSSFGSLGNYFARSPPKHPIAPKRKGLDAQTGSARPSVSDKTANAYTDEGSSVFFSAEESFSGSRSGAAPDPPPQHLDTRGHARAIPRAPKSQSRAPPPLEVPDQVRTSRLNSPTKKLPLIPQTPHRPHTDEFWDQLVVDDWNMEHSPRKLLFDPSGTKAGRQLQTQADNRAASKTAVPAAAVPLTAVKKSTAAAAKAKDAKKMFQKAKHEMAEAFLAELDNTITGGQLSRLAATTGGVKIEWTNKLNTTAGRANWRRETLRPKKTAPVVSVEDNPAAETSNTATTVARVNHHASIELAEKVIDDEHRLLNVIAHEFCHLANFMVSGITGNPHGKEFKAWAAKCSQHFGSRGIQVTTKHAYDIDFKYVWTCEECATEFKRHSKSIDPARHRCGACKGILKQTKPVPRGSGAKNAAKAGGGGGAVKPGPSEYQKFMKEHMAIVRRENPNSPQKLIMTLVADKWTKAKEQKRAASSLATGVVLGESRDGAAKTGVDGLDRALVDLTLN